MTMRVIDRTIVLEYAYFCAKNNKLMFICIGIASILCIRCKFFSYFFFLVQINNLEGGTLKVSKKQIITLVSSKKRKRKQIACILYA